MAVPRTPVGTRGPEPPQKFHYGPKFVGQMLSRNQVSQQNRVNPPPPPLTIQLDRLMSHDYVILSYDLTQADGGP